jgi:radical SAM superfamily enzyme YgiQ (UPF0313 family)
MGERPILEVANRLAAGEPVRSIRDVRGTAFMASKAETPAFLTDPARFTTDRKVVVLPSYEEVRTDKAAYARMAKLFQLETNPGNARRVAQPHGDRTVVYNPPASRSTTTRPRRAPRRSPWTSSTTCRSPASAPQLQRRDPRVRDGETLGRAHARLLRRLHVLLDHRARRAGHPEPVAAERAARAPRDPRMDDFRGTITDLGGPTANMYKMRCRDKASSRSAGSCRVCIPGCARTS